MKKINRKGKINKKRLFLVVFIFVLFIFLLSRVFLGIKGYVSSKKEPEPAVKSQEEIDREKQRIINIAIDPAKGGINEGLATPDGSMKEKDINLDIAKRIKANLDRHEDVKVWLTREYDDNVDTKERVAALKKHNADALVSIRLNAQGKSNEAQGMDTYYSSLLSTKNIADEEKASIKLKKDSEEESDSEKLSEKDIDKKESESEKEKRLKKEEEIKKKKLEKQKARTMLSKDLAQSIQSTTLSFVDFKDRGISSKNFDMLLYTDMPSVIVQCGFISNEADGERLQNEESRQEIADGISDGILNYIDSNRDKIIKDRVNYR